MKTLWRYILNNLIAIDQFINVIFGGAADETISSRLGRHKDTNKVAAFFAKIVDTLFFWDKNHTTKSIEPADRQFGEILK